MHHVERKFTPPARIKDYVPVENEYKKTRFLRKKHDF